ncbi:MAG: hypothetical protein MRY79_06575 [Alphaproteobacteria bacterium]|nr:hypothetical protein [Alphaproteobacteria bacterium]
MVGGKDVKAINDMLQTAFDEKRAGVGEDVVVRIGTFKGRNVSEQKAADQIRISLDEDGNAYVKLITRGADPGLGLLALTGGFKDEGETDQQTADREEVEEAKSETGTLIAKYEISRHPVKGDVRVWGGPDREDGVKNGDIIAMSTMAMVPVVRNAHGIVEAGDDASGAAWVRLSGIKDANVFGIKGHAQLLLEATKLAGLTDQLPESFAQSLSARQNDIAVANRALRSAAIMLLDPAPKIEVCSFPGRDR